MYPFHVKVLTICTGGVKTNLSKKSIQTYSLRLPDTSLYLPILSFFTKRQGYSNANAITAEEYAKQVVSSVRKSWGGGWLWKGYFASSCWFLYTFFWKGIFDVFFVRAFGMTRLRKLLDQSKTKVA